MANAYGFNGQLTQQRMSEWSVLMTGVDVTCTSQADFLPRPVTGQDRQVQVAAGLAWGYGITIESTAAETVQLTSVASGVRHDLVAWRLTWKADGTGGSVALVAVPGSSTAAMPSITQAPGATTALVPICLARVQAGVQTPTIVADYRVWGSQITTATSLDAILYPRHGRVVELVDGTRWKRDGTRWVRQYESNLWWTGIAASHDGTAVGGRYIYPHWQTDPSTVWGEATLPVSVSNARVTIGPGAYILSAWANTPDMSSIAAVAVNSTAALTSVMDSPAGKVHLNLPNGASGPLNIKATSNILVGFRMAGSFKQSATHIKLLRVGDL